MLSIKYKVLSLFCALILSVYSQQKKANYDFQTFKHQNKRAYLPNQQIQRKHYFDQKIQYIAQKKSAGENIPPNDLLDRNEEELALLTNFRPRPQSHNSSDEDKSRFKVSTGFATNPQIYDYRLLGKVSNIKNQLFCGSCWAFVATALYQSLLLLMTSTEYDLSQQYLLECTSGSDCLGGYPEDAIELIKNSGFPLQKAYPYKQKKYQFPGICQSDSQGYIKLAANIIQNQYKFKVYSSPQEIKQLLIENGPMIVGVKAYGNHFQLPGAGGFINDCPTDFEYVDHVVLLVGYTKTHWIIKNSWGTIWGNQGYGYIPFEKDCGIVENVWVTKLDAEWDSGNLIPEEDQTATIQNTTLTIEMTDEEDDGWNENIFGLRQKNQYVATFGEQFTEGSSAKKSVTILKNVLTSVVVYQYGNWRSECGFTIKNDAGEILFKKEVGSDFQKTKIFFSFCEGEKCQAQTTISYAMYLTDSRSNGWNGNSIMITQGETVRQIGETFTQGNEHGPIFLDFDVNQEVLITPGILQANRDQVGFYLRDVYGFEALRRDPGQSYDGDTILGELCPGCQNLLPIKEVPTETVKESSVQSEDILSSITSLTITVICLSVIVVVQIGALIFIIKSISKRKGKQEIKSELTTPSDSADIVAV